MIETAEHLPRSGGEAAANFLLEAAAILTQRGRSRGRAEVRPMGYPALSGRDLALTLLIPGFVSIIEDPLMAGWNHMACLEAVNVLLIGEAGGLPAPACMKESGCLQLIIQWEKKKVRLLPGTCLYFGEGDLLLMTAK